MAPTPKCGKEGGAGTGKAVSERQLWGQFFSSPHHTQSSPEPLSRTPSPSPATSSSPTHTLASLQPQIC